MRPNRQAVSISPPLWDEFFRGSRLACAREIRESLQHMLWERFAVMTNAPEEIRILSERLGIVKTANPRILSSGPWAQELVNQRASHENGG